MKRVLLIACFCLIAIVVVAPSAQAGMRFFVGFGLGYRGPCYNCYRPYYYPYTYATYPYDCYAYGFAPVGSPFVAYGYVPPPRYYPVAPFRAYTLYLPRYHVRVPLQRELRVPARPVPQRVYGKYVTRRYIR